MDDFDERELDQLLSDARRLLDGEPAPPTRPPAQAAQIAHPWEAPDFAGSYDGPARARHVRSASARKPAARNPQAERFVVYPTVDSEPPEEEAFEEKPPRPPRRRKKRHRLRNFLLILLLLLLVPIGLAALLSRQPVAAEGLGARKPGVSTILLAGTDRSDDRTDTLILLTLDRRGRRASLVSIPRDTLVNGSYRVPKINGVYGVNGGGEEGIDMLLQRVGECIGFEPDGYALIDLDAFVGLVDAMGGVKFDVPQDMFYDDPAQNLHIALTAGEQKLDGEQAMGLVRFRKGYTQADLQRVGVQRDFLSAAAKQWLGPKLLFKAPALLKLFQENVETDLTTGNLVWAATSLMAARSNLTAETLPGTAMDILGGSYYVLDPGAVADTVNALCNPYEKAVTTDDLYIRN